MKAKLFKNVYPAILVTLVVVVMASLLTLTQSLTRSELEAQQDKETLEMLRGIFPEASSYIFDEESGIYTIYDSGRKEIGYAFKGRGLGHEYYITILIGLEDKETIKGITVLSHRETLHIGGESDVISLNITPLVDEFTDLKIADCYLKEDGGQVDGITGATVTSTTMVDTVRETALEKIKLIG